MKKRIVLAITGASGIQLGIRCLEILNKLDIDTYLILSNAAKNTLHLETDYREEYLYSLANKVLGEEQLDASVASGSFPINGMIVLPCSIKTLSAIANSYSENLITRTADVCFKEGRPLLLAVREAPFHQGHLQLMEKAAGLGAVIFPPIPMFYSKPQSLEEMMNQLIGRMLMRIGIENEYYPKWEND